MLKGLRSCPVSLRWRLTHSPSPITTLRSLQSLSSDVARSRVIAIPLVRQFHQSSWRNQVAAAAAVETNSEHTPQSQRAPSNDSVEEATPSGPATKFIELGERGLVNRKIIDTITKRMKLDTMTQVQSLTLNEALKHKDVLAQARTGTGKTIGFLLPVIQNILSEDPSLMERQRGFQPRRRTRGGGDRAGDVRALIISPTRELAEQIATEAKRMCEDTGVIVQTAVGGTMKRLHLSKMKDEGCHILVGTPGRIKDIFSDEYSGVEAPNATALVLDEADRLLDQGFWPEIQEIQRLLPDIKEKDRQTLMYSATVSREIVQLARSTMKQDLHYVRTVQEDEEPTHERVKQYLAVAASLENQLPAVLELSSREIQKANERLAEWQQARDPAAPKPNPFKAIVYYNATAETSLSASILISARNLENRQPMFGSEPLFHNTRIVEIHSRLTQQRRTEAADSFRRSESAILMSSDVTARGMDFPGVTHIIQVGLPQTRETYIHRIGRTARAGAEGEGWLILPAAALNEARGRLGQLPLQRDNTLTTAGVDFEHGATPSGESAKFFDLIKNAAQKVPYAENKFEEAYMALLGTFQWLRNKEKLIGMMNRITSVQWGMEKPPNISPALAMKLNLRNVQGVQIGQRRPSADSEERGGRGFDRAGGGGRGGFGGRDGGRGGFGDRRGGDRPSFGDKPSFGDRPRFSDRSGGDRPSYGDRNSGDRPSFGDRRGGDRPSFGDRRGGDRGSFGDRSGGDRGGFGGRDRPSSGFGDRDGGRGGGFGGRGGRGGFGDRGGDRRPPRQAETSW